MAHLSNPYVCQMPRTTVGRTLTPAAIMAMKAGQLLKVPQPANRRPNSSTGAHARAKARWPSFMGKPTRNACRFAKRAINKGGTGGKSKHGKPRERSSTCHHTFPNSMNPNSWNSSRVQSSRMWFGGTPGRPLCQESSQNVFVDLGSTDHIPQV